MARRGPVPWLEVIRLGYGCGLVLAPCMAIAVVGGEPPRPRVVTTARVLGARQILQGLVGLTAPRWWTPRRAAAVDALHAASMIALAVPDLSDRRAALTSTTAACSFAIAGYVSARGRTRLEQHRHSTIGRRADRTGSIY